MTRRSLCLISLLVGFVACCAGAWGAPAGKDPYVGYVYPAGGQQGTVFRVLVAGQRLKDVSNAYVSGRGVRASIVGYEGPGGPLNRLQQEELKRQLQELRAKRMGPKPGENRGAGKPEKAATGQRKNAADDSRTPKVTLPDIPELRNLDQKTPKELMRLADRFINPSKRPKPPIAEQVTVEVTVDSDAQPGDREIRLRTLAGLSNPVVFQVGRIPEIGERADDEESAATKPAQPPVVLNGQIMPGEVDRFSLRLRGGQKLVMAAQARKLIPYLADAVPGWFQAVVTLRDADGHEVAFADECGFDPDPALVFRVPRDGQYELEIRDSIYRGREDFVYRVDVVEESSIASLFPTGSRGGVSIGAARSGGEWFLKQARDYFGLAASSLPESKETEPNDTGQKCVRIALPHVVSGVIASPGDRDVFRFDGRAGDVVVAEVYARRAGSLLDSMLRLTDAAGGVVAWNDDCEDRCSGLLTHHADSYLTAKLPKTGAYYVQVSDTQRHGGQGYVYCLRVGPPRPDFALRVTPSSLNVPAGRAVTATVYALRRDGWDGDIDIVLKDAPSGFALSGARIPKGRDRVRMTLTVPRKRIDEPIPLRMEGRAQVGGQSIVRPVVPADNMMQAFAYYHLVPAKQLMAAVKPGGNVAPELDLPDTERLRIPAGGSARVSYSMPSGLRGSRFQLELSEPPPGVTLGDVKATRDGFELVLKADDKHVGYADNLIVEAFAEVDVKRADGAASNKQRFSAGVLPAIPFEIVQKGSSQQ